MVLRVLLSIWRKKIVIRPAVKHFFEITAGTLAVFAVFVGIFVWRLSTGPISLELIAPNINDALSKALNVRVDFNEANLRWSKETNSIEVAVQRVRIYDAQNTIIGEVPEMDLGFDMAAIFRGFVLPTRIEMEGAAAVIERHTDGRLQLGFSTSLSSDADLEEVGTKGKAPKKKNSLSEYLVSLIIAPQKKSTIGQLTTFVLRNASLAFFDEKSKSLWKATNGEVLFRKSSEGVEARVQAQLLVDDGIVDLTLDGTFNRDTELAVVNVVFSEFMPTQLSGMSPGFSPLKRVTVPLLGKGSITVNGHGVVTEAAVTVLASNGVIDFKGLKIKKAGKAFRESDPDWAKSGPYAAQVVEAPLLESIQIDGAALEASYDAVSERIVIHQLSVMGPENWANFTGGISLVSAGNEAEGEESHTRYQRISLDLNSDNTGFYIPGIVGEQVIFDELSLSVSLDQGSKQLLLQDFSFSVDGGTGNLSGVISGERDDAGKLSPALDLKGRIRNFPVETIVKLWPVFTGMGARGWIDKNMHGTVLTRGEFFMNAPSGVLGHGPLPNDALRFDFAFTGGEAHYIPGLTPAKNIEGSGTLFGNRLSLDVSAGTIGNIKVASAEVNIPRLSPKGSTAVFSAQISGDVSEILETIDMPPLRLTRKIGFDPQTVGGDAQIKLIVRRPMWRRVPPEIVTYDIEASTNEFSLPNTIADLPLTNGAFQLTIDNKGIVGQGPFEWGGVPAMMDWRHALNTESPRPTSYGIMLDVEAAEYAKLGINITGLARGPVKTVIKTIGSGVEIIRADIESDLTNALMSIAPLDWNKEAGKPALATLHFVPGKDGARGFKDLILSGEGMDIQGNLNLARDYSLIKAEFPVFKLGKNIDFQFSAERRVSDGGFVLRAEGEKLDIGAMVKEYFASTAGNSNTPINIRGDISTLRLNEGVVLEDAHFIVAGNGYRLTEFDVEGSYPEGGGLYAKLTGPSSGRRHLVLSSSDAGAVARGVFGYKSMEGGLLEFSAYYEPPSLSEKTQEPRVEDQPAEELDEDQIGGPELEVKSPETLLPENAPDIIYGEIDIEDFQIIDLPVLAQLLSAGSFTGLGDLLNGEGLSFETMEVSFVIEEGKMEFDQSRMVGSSMGITMGGVYDRSLGTVDLKGTLAPAYSVNSALGGLPLIGDLFVSREGEGLLALTYGITGPLEEARVFVNPLSALTPGFLRRLFQFKSRPKETPPMVENQP